jgi:hypothetical protein
MMIFTAFLLCFGQRYAQYLAEFVCVSRRMLLETVVASIEHLTFVHAIMLPGFTFMACVEYFHFERETESIGKTYCEASTECIRVFGCRYCLSVSTNQHNPVPLFTQNQKRVLLNTLVRDDASVQFLHGERFRFAEQRFSVAGKVREKKLGLLKHFPDSESAQNFEDGQKFSANPGCHGLHGSCAANCFFFHRIFPVALPRGRQKRCLFGFFHSLRNSSRWFVPFLQS